MQDVYLLDKNLDIVHVFDSYVSLIWSKRYVDLGDCELYVAASTEVLQLVKIGYYLKRPDDDMICVIRKIDLTTSEDGNYISISGTDVRCFADQRVICSSEISTSEAERVIQALLVESISVGAEHLVPGRGLYKANGSALFDYNNLTGLDGVWNATFAHENVGSKIREILKSLGWGMRFILKPNDPQRRICQEVYKGADRSKSVVFATEYENLESSDYTINAEGAENAALAFDQAEEGETTYRFAGSAPGVDRYEKAIKVSGIGDTITYADLVAMFPGGTLVAAGEKWRYTVNPAYILALPGAESEFTQGWTLEVIDGQPFYVSGYAVWLGELDTDQPEDKTKVTMAPVLKNLLIRQRGIEQISGKGLQQSFSAVINPRSTFVYGEDFFLGDIVTVRNEYGIQLPARIVEVVEVQDQNGYSCQPKLDTSMAGEQLKVTVINGSYTVAQSMIGQVVISVQATSPMLLPPQSSIILTDVAIQRYEVSEDRSSAVIVFSDIGQAAKAVIICAGYVQAEAALAVGFGASMTGASVPAIGAEAALELDEGSYVKGAAAAVAAGTLEGGQGIGTEADAVSAQAVAGIAPEGVKIGLAAEANNVRIVDGDLQAGVKQGLSASGVTVPPVLAEAAGGLGKGFAASGILVPPTHGAAAAGVAIGASLVANTFGMAHGTLDASIAYGLSAEGEAVQGYTRRESTFIVSNVNGQNHGQITLNIGRNTNLDFVIDWGDGTVDTITGGNANFYKTHGYSSASGVTEWPINVKFAYNAGNTFTWKPGYSTSFRFVDQSLSDISVKKAWFGANCVNVQYLSPTTTKMQNNFELLDLGRSITALPDNFMVGTNLKSMIIPKQITQIGSYAFQLCANLTEITVEGSPSIFGSFCSNSGLQKATFLSSTPPTLSSAAITGWPPGLPIYVHAVDLNTYRTAQYWSVRADDIRPIEE